MSSKRGVNTGIGAGVGTVIAPGLGTVLGAAIGSAFGSNPKTVGRKYDELNPGGGGAYGIPGGLGDTPFNPQSVWGNLPDKDRGPFPNGAAYNPYGIARPQQSYGKSAIYGGQQDLMKSIATRSLATALAEQQFREAQTGGPPTGLQNALQAFADREGGGLLSESYQNNIAPAVDMASYMDNQAYRAKLSELLQGAYMQGGALYGGATKAWAAAKGVDKARREQKNAAIKNWVGAFLPQEAGIRDIGQGAVGLGA